MNKEACLNCIFYKAPVPEVSGGQCRRYPPQVHVHLDTYEASTQDSSGPYTGINCSTYSSFPEVDADEWCGEFKEIHIFVKLDRLNKLMNES